MTSIFAGLALSLLAADDPVASPSPHPIVPALVRDGLSDLDRGRVLLGELGCTACHESDASRRAIAKKAAPDLAGVGERVRPDHLRAFIAAPEVVKPGTTMPNLLRRFDEASRDAAAEALTHYLASLATRSFVPEAPDRVAGDRGRRLFHTIGCVACHDPTHGSPDDVDPSRGVVGSAPLGRLEGKYSVASLTSFLAAPLEVRPSGRMPDFRLSPTEAYDIANYLLRDLRVGGPLEYTLYLDLEGGGLDALEGKGRRSGIAPGFSLGEFASLREEFALRFRGHLDVVVGGEYEFHLESSAQGRLRIDEEPVVSLEERGAARGRRALDAGLHRIEVEFLHRQGPPVLRLDMSGPERSLAPVPSTMLRSEIEPEPPYESFVVDPREAEHGRRLFEELRCGRCHSGASVEGGASAPDLAALDLRAGCLSGESGTWPTYPLRSGQIEDLRAAIAADDSSLSREEEIRLALARSNCIACHRRGEWGGPVEERSRFFETADPNLGETGRLPPPLTGAGAKLQETWLAATISSGQSLRPYMSLRMPAFGRANAEHLAALFAAEDAVPPVAWEPPPENREVDREIRELGRTLVGDAGMRCIACHTFRGQAAGTMAAIDIIETTTDRLRKDWFYHYMLEPARFREETIMPLFFPDGRSLFTDHADGDAKRQLHAIWEYLAEGRNTREPNGLRRLPLVLEVGDEAVMLRRSAQDSGKRAISVGLPLRWNFVFDAENVCLSQVWRGDFIDAVGVWTGQGSGAVRILSRERVRLGDGPAFAMLADRAAPWPSETSRALGIRFRGYQLDAKRRPAFEYVVGAVRVRDAPVEVAVPEGDPPLLRRTISTRSDAESDSPRGDLWFRAAVHQEIAEEPEGAARIGRHLRLRASSTIGGEVVPVTIRSSGQSLEAIVPVPPPSGDRTASLVIDYEWVEDER